MGQPSSGSEAPRQFSLDRARMLAFLDELKSAAGTSRSLYVPAGSRLDTDFQGIFGQAIPPGLGELVSGSPTGAVVFWGARKYLILPPFPLAIKLSAEGYHVEPLREVISREYTIALVMIRLGSYAIGVSRGEHLVSAKAGTGLVHARHRQGGSSQRRFERHREKQIEQFLIRVCRHIREELEPHARSIEYIAYGGARTTILLLRKRCSILERFDACTLPPLLTIPDPRKSTLEAALGQVWSSRVYEWD